MNISRILTGCILFVGLASVQASASDSLMCTAPPGVFCQTEGWANAFEMYFNPSRTEVTVYKKMKQGLVFFTNLTCNKTPRNGDLMCRNYPIAEGLSVTLTHEGGDVVAEFWYNGNMGVDGRAPHNCESIKTADSKYLEYHE